MTTVLQTINPCKIVVVNWCRHYNDDDFKIEDDAYEYDEDEYMYIFMLVTDSDGFIKAITRYLSSHKILGNNILESCIIAKESSDGYETLHSFNDSLKFKPPPDY